MPIYIFYMSHFFFYPCFLQVNMILIKKGNGSSCELPRWEKLILSTFYILQVYNYSAPVWPFNSANNF